MTEITKEFPEGLTPITAPFKFKCHAQLSCFTSCCKKVDIVLYPYDIIRLKNELEIDSEKFLHDYIQLVKGANPFFPSPMLKLSDEDETCPFLTESGCSVYANRPSACRTYPLERAVSREKNKGQSQDYYFLTDHSYCKGHGEDETFTIKDWLRNQRINDFNLANDLWSEIDTILHTNPWKGEGVGGAKQQVTFMISYNIDGFRRFADERQLTKQFKLDKDFRKRIATDDLELQKFGFMWLKQILTGEKTLMAK